MYKSETQPVSPYHTALECGRIVAIAAASLIGGVTAFGKVIEEYDAIAAALSYAWMTAWTALLGALTIGGSFWGSVTMAGVAMAAVAWSKCVRAKLSAGPGARPLLVACVVLNGAGTVILAVLAIELFRMDAVTPYQSTARYIVYAGFVLRILYFLAELMSRCYPCYPEAQIEFRRRQHMDALSVDKRLAFAARLKGWGLRQWERERVMAVFNVHGEAAAIEAARSYSKNIPE